MQVVVAEEFRAQLTDGQFALLLAYTSPQLLQSFQHLEIITSKVIKIDKSAQHFQTV